MPPASSMCCNAPEGAPVRLLASRRFAAVFFGLVSVAFLSPLYPTLSNWGSHDWDQHCFYFEVARKSLLRFGQFPLWNPYHCGGTAALAEPQSAFLSLALPLVLGFGTVEGIKLGFLVHTALGMFGMHLLSRHFKLSVCASYFPALVFFLSSWYPLHLVEGHIIYVTFAFLPYAFLFYLKGADEPKYAVLSGAALALMVLGGGVYTVLHAFMLLVLHCGLSLASNKGLASVRALAIAVVAAFCLSAVKTLPMLEYLSAVHRPVSGGQYTSWRLLLLALFSRGQAELYLDRSLYLLGSLSDAEISRGAMLGTVPWRWHEYGAYVGIVPIALAAVAVVQSRRHWRLAVCALVFLVLCMGRAFPGNPWALVHCLPFVSQLHGPSRFIIPFVFLMSLLAGIALTEVQARLKRLATVPGRAWLRLVVPGLVCLVSLDLAWVGMRTVGLGFERKRTAGPTLPFRHVWVADPFHDQLAAVLRNVGVLNGYARTGPAIAAVPLRTRSGRWNPAYMGEAHIVPAKRPLAISYFSPNNVEVALPSGVEGDLVLNQNFLRGWRCAGRRVKPYNDLVSVEVGPEDRVVVLRYLPSSFVLGSIISLLSSAFLAVELWRVVARTKPSASGRHEDGA